MENHINRISEHYAHAKEKHPRFANSLCAIGEDSETELLAEKDKLSAIRDFNSIDLEQGTSDAMSILDCEICEAIVEIRKGDNGRAVEELYDAVAVLLRAIDVLENREKLIPIGECL